MKSRGVAKPVTSPYAGTYWTIERRFDEFAPWRLFDKTEFIDIGLASNEFGKISNQNHDPGVEFRLRRHETATEQHVVIKEVTEETDDA